jgi:hypothetical protein
MLWSMTEILILITGIGSYGTLSAVFWRVPVVAAMLLIASCGDARPHRVVVAYPEQWTVNEFRNCAWVVMPVSAPVAKKRQSAARRKAQAQRMKAYWAAKRKKGK